MAEKLKPCPFCGGEMRIGQDWYVGVHNHYFLWCSRCDVYQGISLDYGAWRGEYKTEGEAVKGWYELREKAASPLN